MILRYFVLICLFYTKIFDWLPVIIIIAGTLFTKLFRISLDDLIIWRWLNRGRKVLNRLSKVFEIGVSQSVNQVIQSVIIGGILLNGFIWLSLLRMREIYLARLYNVNLALLLLLNPRLLIQQFLLIPTIDIDLTHVITRVQHHPWFWHIIFVKPPLLIVNFGRFLRRRMRRTFCWIHLFSLNDIISLLFLILVSIFLII